MSQVELSSPAVLIPAVLVLVVLSAVLIARPVPRARRAAWLGLASSAVAAGALLGLGLAWLLSDVLDVFGIALTIRTRMWAAVAFALIGLAVARMLPMREAPETRWRMLAALAVIPAVLVGALGINADFGLYRTAQDVVDAIAPPPVQQLSPIAASTTSAQDLARWVAPPDMPASGVVRHAQIPGTVSGFAARTAVVWLPPAAQVAQPPALPLLVLLAGQPGDPDSFWSAARLEQLMEKFQATHGGLAPIVVVPDQNGATDVNLLCADTTVARVDTYLSVDLVAWARANLPVLTDRTSMAIGGYSQGGTCSLQVGLRHPELFATVLAMANERSIFDDPAALPTYFAGDRAAGDPFDPPWILANNGPFPPMQLLLAVGEQDAVFTPNVQETARAARSAGIAATTWSVPGTAHDFYMVYGAVEHFLPDMAATMGIPASGSP